MLSLCIIAGLIPTFAITASAASYTSWKQYSGYWSSYKMGNGSATVSRYGCTTTSVCMAAVRLGCESDSNFDPGVFVNRMNKNGGYTSGGGMIWSVMHKVIPNMPSIKDVYFSGQSTAQRISTIKSYLDSGYAVIVKMDRWSGSSHYVLADYVSNGELYILDPGGANGNIKNKYGNEKNMIAMIQVYGKSGQSYAAVNPVPDPTPAPPAHVHSWTTSYESAHPHKEYKYCSGCGEKSYTGNTRKVSSCKSCYPIGNTKLTRSFNKTSGYTTFYRGNVANANSHTLTIYRKPSDGGSYSQYTSVSMNSTSYNITLPQGYVYYATLNSKNSNTGQSTQASCDSFRIYNTYTVSYNANGGSGAPSSQTKIQDTNLTLSSTIPRMTGHIFKGWASSKTAKDAQYSAGGTYTKNAKITLYAVWEPETYVIKFDANGGKGELAETTITYGNTLRMPNSVVKDGFYLKGWSTNKNSTNADYRANMDYKLTANTQLYAVWGSSTWGGTVATEFAGGDGTAENPYQISNAGELAHLAKIVNEQSAAPEYKYYVLTDNISLGYEEWVPIGVYDNENQYFKGSFDGNGFTISDLSISQPNSGYIGIFGYTKDSEIKNINVTGDITGISSSLQLYVGAIAGYSNHLTAENCNGSYINISDISSSSTGSNQIGALFGTTFVDSSIRNCTANECYVSAKDGLYILGTIVGYSRGQLIGCETKAAGELFGSTNNTQQLLCGGIAGAATGTVKECKVNAGFLSNNLYASKNGMQIGGIAGWANGTIELCSVNFNNGLNKNIDGQTYQSTMMGTNTGTAGFANAGGIVGYTKPNSKIKDCKYNGSSISAESSNTPTYAGGIAGYMEGSTTEKIAAQGGMPLNRDLLPKRDGYKATWYTDSDFKNEYDFTQNVSADTTLYAKWEEYTPEIWDGTTSEPAYNADTKTYTVTNGKELAWIAGVVNGTITEGNNIPEETALNGYTVELSDDIYLNETYNVDNWATDAPNNEWTPIGAGSATPFSGIFNGNKHRIIGLYINQPQENVYHKALIGFLDGGTITDVGIESGYVNVWNYSGALVGGTHGGTIRNCYNNASVNGKTNVAGIVGAVNTKNSKLVVDNCVNEGNITLQGMASGGVLGCCVPVNEIEVTNCRNTGNVTSTDLHIGGIVGYVESSDEKFTASNCSNNGNISGTHRVGGICGTLGNKNTLSCCFNSGNISGTKNIGGITGYNLYNIENCYHVNGTVKGTDNVGGITGFSYKGTVGFCYSVTSSGSSASTNYGNIVGYNNSSASVIKYSYCNRSPVYGKNEGTVSNSSVVSNMKSLSNLSGFTSSIWTVNSNVNNGYPYVKALEEAHKTYTIYPIEDKDDIYPINRVFANVNGIIYGQSAKNAQAGGIIGHVGADGAETSPAKNMLAIADRVSAVSSGSSYYAKAGDIVGEMTNNAFDFSDTYAYSSMDLSAVNSAKAANASTSNISSSRTLAQIKRAAFLKQVFGEPYQSLEYLKTHPDAVWVQKDGELPELYFNVLNDITVSETENGTIAVDRAQAVDDEIVNVTATPAEEYELNKVYVNGKEIDGTNFAVDGDSDVFATFIEKTPEFNVEIEADANATASLTNVDEANIQLSSVGEFKLFADDPITELTASDGEEIKVTTAADEDYTVDAIYVNGEEIAGDSFIIDNNTTVTLAVSSLNTDIDVVTNDAEFVYSNCATVSGTVNTEDASRYIRYWKESEPETVYTTDVEDGAGDYTADLWPLDSETTYCFQMTEFGEVKTFTTPAEEDIQLEEDNPTPSDEPIEPTTKPTTEPTTEPTEEPIKREICFEIQNQLKDESSVSANVVNTTDEAQSGLVIYAAYDGSGALVKVEAETITDLAANGTFPVEFAIVDDAEKYKILVWDSWKSMLPIAASVDIE